MAALETTREGTRTASLGLTAAQQGIWLGQQLDPASARYNAAECIELRGDVDSEALHASIVQALGECDVVMRRIVASPAGPLQQLGGWRTLEVARVPLAEDDDALTQALRWMRADLVRPIDPMRGPPVRQALLHAGPSCVYWYHAAHHVALDGFGFAMIARRVAELYSARLRSDVLPPSPFRALSAVLDEDLAYQRSAQRDDDRAFWLARLSGMPTPVTLASRSAVPSDDSRRLSYHLSADSQTALTAIARRCHATWGDALIAALALYLQRESGAGEVVLGLPVMGRLGSVALRVPCMAMNILPLRLPIAHDDSFSSVITRVARELRETRPHARYRYEQLRRDLGLVGGERRLFGTVINLMPFELDLRFAETTAQVHNVSAGPVDDLSVGVHPCAGGGLRFDFDANCALYDDASLARHQQGFVALLADCIAAPERAHAARSVVRQPVLVGEPVAQPVLDVVAQLERWVRDTPAAIALEHRAQQLTYGQLDRAARDVAARLAHRGVGRDALLAIMLPRGIDAIVAIWGTLIAGCAYLPLDAEGPTERNARILADANPSLLLTSRALVSLAPSSLEVLLVDEQTGLSHQSVHGELAYVIYTSGSTGQPNGVVIERSALAHFVTAARQRYQVQREDRVLQFAALHFDASVEEIFVTLCSGATLVLRSEEMLQSIPQLLRACRDARISILDLPTALFHELAYCISTDGGELSACVRLVIIGGEAVRPDRVERFRRSAPASTRLLNTYGPTECTVVATCCVLAGEGAPPHSSDAPIGTPLPGLSAAVLDESGRPVVEGATGELCLMGPTLARGYLGRPSLQAQRYVTLRALPAEPRAYRTGDLVRVGSDGQLAFVGRVDDELKLSGFRIDLSEIESVLLRHPQLREACVVVHGTSDERRLVAHLVASDSIPSAAELRAHCKQALLAAAVPTSFRFEARLPRTRSGKIDRASLRKSAAAQPAGSREEPADALEREVLALWSDVLGASDLSVHDDFFERGGQSLQTIQLATRLGSVLGREVPVALIFRHPTVAELVGALRSRDAAPPRAGLPPTLLSDAVLSADVVALTAEPGQPREHRQLLLTGASGFVGIHLLHSLLRETKAQIVCLVRASDAAQAMQRLRAASSEHGLAHDKLHERVRAVAADLAQPRFGLGDAAYHDLSVECDALYHNAATVSLTRSYGSLRGSNVEATREIIRLATTGRAKPVHHVSTLAVAPGAQLAAEVPEGFVTAHAGLRDGYTQSKWAAERLLEQASQRGVDVTVYRLGRVVGPLHSGFVSRDDIVWRLLRAGIPRGVLPAIDLRETWTPVDYVARAITALSRDRRPTGQVFNLTASRELALRELFGWVSDYGYRVTQLPVPAFCAQLSATLDDEAAATLAFFTLQDDSPKAGLGAIRSDACDSALAAHGIACPPIDREALHRYLDFCVRTGLLPRPASPSTSGETA